MLKQLRLDENDVYLQTINGILFCLLIIILSRLIIYFEAYTVQFFINQGNEPNLFSHWFLRWDSGWYMSVINRGYAAGPIKDFSIQQNWAFFPLYPISVKLVAQLIPINTIVLGQIMSNVYFSVGVIIFYRLLKRYFNEQNSRFGVLLLCFSPFNIYFVSIYTESLFLLLSISGVLLAMQGRWFYACILGALLSATRPNGLLIGLPFLYLFYQQWRANSLPLAKIFYMAIIPTGILAYMIYLYYHTGDPIAFVHVEAAWGRTGWPDSPRLIVGRLLGFIHLSYNTKVFFISLFLTIYSLYKKYKVEPIYYFAMLLPAFASGTPTSLARYSATLYTFYFCLVVFCRSSPIRKLFIFLITLMLLAVYIVAWMSIDNRLI